MLCRLPDDIISELFDILAVIECPRLPTFGPLYPHPRPEAWKLLGWIRLTHVCRRFREVGLRRSALWGRVVIVFPSAFDTLLARSRSAPLSLRLDKGVLQGETLNAILPNHVHRAVEIGDADYSTVIRGWKGSELAKRHPRREWGNILAGRTMPLLTSLRLIGWRDFKNSEAVNAEAPFVAPVLRHYTADRFIPFTAPSLRDLRLNDPRMKWTHYIDILETCPLLVNLYIHGGLWSTLDEKDALRQREAWMEEPELESALTRLINTSRSRMVRMAHLRKMHVDGGFETYLLLRHLSIPAKATLSVAMYDRVARFRAFAPLIMDQLRRPNWNVLAILGIPDTSDTSPTPTSVTLTENNDGWDWPFGINGVTLTLKFARPARIDTTPPQLEHIPSDVALQIRALTIIQSARQCPERTYSSEEHERWRTALQRFSGVTALYIQQDTHPIFGILKSESPTTSVAVLPNLHTIVVHTPTLMKPLTATWWTEFVGLLGVRKAMGCPVARVVLTGRLRRPVNENLGSPDANTEEAEPEMEASRRETLEGLVEEVVDEREVVVVGSRRATSS
ncbi:hypothetical protein PENSPDRAFT_656752 [Peniophora sp. CONT]|nr:hypothetical protein PENSPDRAFT_656752 [Peniophora sp. CONT]